MKPPIVSLELSIDRPLMLMRNLDSYYREKHNVSNDMRQILLRVDFRYPSNILSLACMIFLCVIMFACSSPEEPEGPERYEISGTVTDADTGKPISEATMNLLGSGLLQTKTTNSEGKYWFIHNGGCRDGGDVTGPRVVRVEAKKTGYKRIITAISCSTRVQTIDFKLEPGFDPPPLWR